MSVVRRLGLFKAYDRVNQASHQLCVEVFGNCTLWERPHCAILGYGDLKWGNITITRVYFVEGLGHNLFSVGQFCDADLEVAFRRNTCFIRDLDGCPNMSVVRRLGLFKAYDRVNQASHQLCVEVFGNCTLWERPHCAILGYGDLKWGNITITRVYFVEEPSIFVVVSCSQLDIQGLPRCNCGGGRVIRPRKPDISYLHVFGALCYPKNDREDIGKLGAKGDIGFFIGYSANSVAYRVYNRRTKKVMETMNVTFDELSVMAFEQNSSRLGLQSMTSGQISSELELTYAPSTITPQRPTPRSIPAALVLQNLQAPTASMSFQDSAPQQRNLTPSPTASAANNVLNAVFEGGLFVNPFATPSTKSAVSSTQYVDPSNMHTFYQSYPHDYQCTKDHPLEQVIGEPSRPVLTRNQLKTDGDMCIYALTVSIMEPKTVKEALTDPAWIESMQEKLHQFIRLDV
nr:hypothetical protein [Tanacetum cinerariifolium]